MSLDPSEIFVLVPDSAVGLGVAVCPLDHLLAGLGSAETLDDLIENASIDGSLSDDELPAKVKRVRDFNRTHNTDAYWQ